MGKRWTLERRFGLGSGGKMNGELSDISIAAPLPRRGRLLGGSASATWFNSSIATCLLVCVASRPSPLAAHSPSGSRDGRIRLHADYLHRALPSAGKIIAVKDHFQRRLQIFRKYAAGCLRLAVIPIAKTEEAIRRWHRRNPVSMRDF